MSISQIASSVSESVTLAWDPGHESRRHPVHGGALRKVPKEILDPVNTWGNKDEYWQRYDGLAARFIENF